MKNSRTELINIIISQILKKQPETIKINLVVINLCFILVFFLTKNFLLIHPSTSESIFIELTRIMNLSQYISSAPDITDTLNFTYSLFTQFFINFLSILNQIIFKLKLLEKSFEEIPKYFEILNIQIFLNVF